MNTFTAQDMHDYGDYVANLNSAMLSPNFEKWCKERFEPAKKVIDLSVLIDSEVLCVFFDPSTPSSATGKLKKIRGSAAYVSNNRDSSGMPVSSRACKPLMNHIHAWQGGECPLPEGFMVKVWYRDDSVRGDMCSHFNWKWSYKAAGSDIIAFEVLGVDDGYVMPWEVSDD